MINNKNNSSWNCLIVGGTGLIGRLLAKALLEQGHRVKILSRDAKKQDNLKHTLTDAEWIVDDLSKPGLLEKALFAIDIVFHLASSVIPKTSNDNLIYDVESNLIGSINLLDQARLNKVKKVIFISSGGAVYGIPQSIPIVENHPVNPISSYGIVKLAIEKYLYLYHQDFGLDYSILRVSNAYGFPKQYKPGFGAVDTFIRKVRNKEAIEIWGDGSIIRDYIHIDDIVSALTSVMSYSGPHKLFNIGSGVGFSLNELIGLIESEVNQKVTVKYLTSRQVDVPANIVDISLAKLHLNWTPKMTLQEGIKLLFQYNSKTGRNSSVINKLKEIKL